MSKISVYKFTLRTSEETAKRIIHNYLVSKGFRQTENPNCFRTRFQKPSTSKVLGKAILTGLLTGGKALIDNTSDYGLEYYFNHGELIIKAYLINDRLNFKSMIHSTFGSTQEGILYQSYLRYNVFRLLEENNCVLESTETEKINDGSEKRVFIHDLKVILLIFGPIILLIMIPILLHL